MRNMAGRMIDTNGQVLYHLEEHQGSRNNLLSSRDDITASTEEFLNRLDEPECDHHPSLRISKFCTVCKMAVCRKCISEDHSACSHISVHKGIEHQRTFLEASLLTADEHIRIIQKRLTEVQNLESAEKQQRKEISALLEENIQKILEALQDRHNELYDQLEQLFKRRRKRLENLKTTLQNKHRNLNKGKAVITDLLIKSDSKSILESQRVHDEHLQGHFLDNRDFHPGEEDFFGFVPHKMEKVLGELQNFGLICDTPVRPKNSTLPVGFRQTCATHEEVRIPLVLRDTENREICLESAGGLQEFAVSLVSPYENAYFVNLEKDENDDDCFEYGSTGGENEEFDERQKQLYLKYRLDLEGTYDLSVKVLGEHIKGSPFTIKAVTRNTGNESDKDCDGRHRPVKSSQSPSRRRITSSRSLSNVKKQAAMSQPSHYYGLNRSAGEHQMQHRSISRSGTHRSASRGHTSTLLSSNASSFIKDDFKFKLGLLGRKKGEFSNPQGVCVTKEDRHICVTDSGNACVQIFTESGECILKFGQRGRELGQMQRPTDIAETSHGNLVISDFDNRCVHVCSKDGRYLTRFGQKFLHGPKGIAVDLEGNIIVVDNKSCSVCVFKSTGKFYYKFGTRGTADHQFAGPHYVAVNSQNQYLITDFHNHMVKLFDSRGIFIFAFGRHGTENGAFHAPTGIAVDRKDNIIVADWKNCRIQIFDRDGNFLNMVNSNASLLFGPQGVAMLDTSIILVIDSGNHCCKAYDFPTI